MVHLLDDSPMISNNEGELVDDEGKLIDQLDQWLASDSDCDLDSGLGDEGGSDENDPEWNFEEGKTWVKDTNYIFCPAPHQKQVLCLFTNHFWSTLPSPTHSERIQVESKQNGRRSEWNVSDNPPKFHSD